jgi:hypothetical protein
MISWILSRLFPIQTVSFHPRNDMREILNYHDRMQRAAGEDYTFERTNFTIGQRIGKVVQGEYVDISEHAGSRLHYSADERQFVAVYPTPAPPDEPTPEEISVEALETLNTPDRQRIDELVDLLKITNG